MGTSAVTQLRVSKPWVWLTTHLCKLSGGNGLLKARAFEEKQVEERRKFALSGLGMCQATTFRMLCLVRGNHKSWRSVVSSEQVRSGEAEPEEGLEAPWGT